MYLVQKKKKNTHSMPPPSLMTISFQLINFDKATVRYRYGSRAGCYQFYVSSNILENGVFRCVFHCCRSFSVAAAAAAAVVVSCNCYFVYWLFLVISARLFGILSVLFVCVCASYCFSVRPSVRPIISARAGFVIIMSQR